MKLLQVAMTNTSISMLSIFDAGYLVRGGITYGDVYFDELGFFGPAIEKAYEIESNCADIPIIMLEPTLGKEFSKWEEENGDFERINSMKYKMSLYDEFMEEYDYRKKNYSKKGDEQDKDWKKDRRRR